MAHEIRNLTAENQMTMKKNEFLSMQNDEVKKMNLADSYSHSQDYILTKQKCESLKQELAKYREDHKLIVGLELKNELLQEQIRE